jgi:hypothetical protein
VKCQRVTVAKKTIRSSYLIKIIMILDLYKENFLIKKMCPDHYSYKIIIGIDIGIGNALNTLA